MKAKLALCAFALVVATQAVAGKPDPDPNPAPPPVVAPEVTDTFNCTLRYYGTISRDEVRDADERGGALVETSGTMGSTRGMAVGNNGTTVGTIGWASLYSTLGETGLKAELGVFYQHRVVAIPNVGKKAFQKVVLSGRLWKGATLLTPPDLPVIPGTPTVGVPNDDLDPMKPANGWKEVKLFGDVPQLALDDTPVYVETIGSQGVMQLRCTNYAGIVPGGVIH